MEEEDNSGELTIGEFRVGVSFNPSNSGAVAQIKAAAAALIDLINNSLPADDGQRMSEHEIRVFEEQRRLRALAQTAIEEGAMWAVKAVTKA